MAGSQTTDGIIRPPRRGPGSVALGLWRAGGTFRGFTEFAFVGGLVLAFLHGGGAANMMRNMRPTAQDASSPHVASSISKPGSSRDVDGILATPPVQKPVAPRMSDLTLLPSYFNGTDEPLRSHLIAALDAYRAKNSAGIERALATDDQEDPRVLLMRGIGQLQVKGPEAIAAGISMLERAVVKGEARAMAVLGALKMNGLAGYPRDLDAGRILLERAVEAGDGPAARVLGDGYINGYAGTIDAGRAQSLLQLASDRGDIRATYHLGELLLTGHGLPKNELAGERLVEIAAKTGLAEAQATMGTIRLKPYITEITDNPDEALDWYERAAAQGNARAMFNLGMFYVQLGMRIHRNDAARATNLFRRCTETTLSSQCVFAYATSLDYGMGTPRDPVKAYALYSMAALAGDKPKAKQRRDEIGAKLTDAEKQQATVISNQLMARKPIGGTVRVVVKKSGDDAKTPVIAEPDADRLVPVFKRLSPQQ
jgi:TPR repeat protein